MSPLRTTGYLALGVLPLAYLHVPGLPLFTRSLALLAAGGAFGMAWLAGGGAPATPAASRAGRWAVVWIAWQALSALWTEPSFRWAVLWPVLHSAAVLAVAAGIAGDPGRRRGLALVLSGWGTALGIFALNVAKGGIVETWTLGARLEGRPVDHLPFGNHNTAALLVSALIPPALGALPLAPLPCLGAAALLIWLLAKISSLGAVLGLILGALIAQGVLACPRLETRTRKIGLALTCLAAFAAALWLGNVLARRPPPPWRLTTTFGIRTLIWESAVRDWASAPWLGHGAGTFALRFAESRAPLYPLSEYAMPRALHAYNLPLQTLCETGIVGTLLLGAALFALVSAAHASSGAGWFWTLCALLAQSLGGDALVDPLGLGCLAVAAGMLLAPAIPIPTVADTATPHREKHPWLAAVLGGVLIACLASFAAQIWAFRQAHEERLVARDLDRAGKADQGRAAWLTAESRFAHAAQGGIPSFLGLDAQFERGLCLLRLERPKDALKVYRDLMDRGGPYGNARRAAGLAALHAGETETGRNWLEEHLAFDPCDLEARKLLAASFPEMRDRLEADFWTTAARAPDSHPFLERGAAWRYEAGDWEGAWRLLGRVLRVHPDRQDIRANAVDAGLRSGHAAEALALAKGFGPRALADFLGDMDSRVAAQPGVPEPRGMRALMRLAAGDLRGAREDLEAIPRADSLVRWRQALAALIGETPSS